MSKAEDRYLDYFLDGRLRNCGERNAFIYGYHQAEKDLELSWKDIEKICLIAKESHKFYGFRSEIVYDDILKRFKEKRMKDATEAT